MGIVSRLFERRNGNPENPSTPWDVVADALQVSMGTATGINVNEAKAMRLSTVFACVRVIAETMATVPLLVYQRAPDGSRVKSLNHPLYRTLHDQANPVMNAFIWRELSAVHALLWGNAYSQIVEMGSGSPQLWPLQPQYMRVTGQDGKLVYEYRAPNKPLVMFSQDEILHVKGLGFDGIAGKSVISFARDSIGLGLATEEYGARWFGNGARPGGVIQMPNKLSDQAYLRLRRSFEDRHGGVEGAHKVAILEEGGTYNAVSLPPDDSQFLETRTFQVPEICRWFRMSPRKVQAIEGEADPEQVGIEFVTDTIQPWAVRFEQAFIERLFGGTSTTGYYAEFMLDGLQRGNQEGRYTAYAIGRQWGWLSANDIRARENMNAIDGGDEYLVPMNMVPADDPTSTVPSSPTPPKPTTNGPASTPPGLQPPMTPVANKNSQRALSASQTSQTGARQNLRAEFAPELATATEAILASEQEQLMRQIKAVASSLTDVAATLATFYGPSFRAAVVAKVLPVMQRFAEKVGSAAADEIGGNPVDLTDFMKNYTDAFSSRWAGSSQKKLLDAATNAINHGGSGQQVQDAMNGVFGGWKGQRPQTVAKEESVRSGDAAALTTWKGNGVMEIRWVSDEAPHECGYCAALDGTVIGVDQYFLKPGVPYQPDGVKDPLTVSRNVANPPAHIGCGCTVVAVKE